MNTQITDPRAAESAELSLRVKPLLDAAREKGRELMEAEASINEGLRTLCVKLWELGESLLPLKEAIGHGKWMFYVAANFPMLGDSETSRVRRANEAKAFFLANPNWPDSATFSIESIRKCVFHLAPEKERPEIPGDQTISPQPHHLSFVNGFAKWQQRIKAGLDGAPAVPVFQREMIPVILGSVEFGGNVWTDGNTTIRFTIEKKAA